MLRTGILNPHVLDLLARIRHTNTLVISDLGFPFWPEIETVDISLVAGVPSIAQVLEAIAANFIIGRAWMAEEFRQHNPASAEATVRGLLGGAPLDFEPHVDFKKRVLLAIGLIRTGGTESYSNIILESA
jgi:D-ribose pyranase